MPMIKKMRTIQSISFNPDTNEQRIVFWAKTKKAKKVAAKKVVVPNEPFKLPKKFGYLATLNRESLYKHVVKLADEIDKLRIAKRLVEKLDDNSTRQMQTYKKATDRLSGLLDRLPWIIKFIYGIK